MAKKAHLFGTQSNTLSESLLVPTQPVQEKPKKPSKYEQPPKHEALHKLKELVMSIARRHKRGPAPSLVLTEKGVVVKNVTAHHKAGRIQDPLNEMKQTDTLTSTRFWRVVQDRIAHNAVPVECRDSANRPVVYFEVQQS